MTMTDNNEKRTITVEGKIRKFKVGDLEINTISEDMTDEDYDVMSYLLSLDTSDMVSLIAKVIDFKALGHDHRVIMTLAGEIVDLEHGFAGDSDSYKETLIEEIKFLLR